MSLILEGKEGKIQLGDNTLVFALDDTGHEEFKDSRYQVFGIGGCAFQVKDYQRLIEKPFNNMCETYFPEVERPFHSSSKRQYTEEQMNALAHFFSTLEFFRLARIMDITTKKEVQITNIQLITGALLNAVRDIAKGTDFDRIFILFEDSERIRDEVMAGLSGRALTSEQGKINIELGCAPKKISFPALEVADIIIHTAGSQVRGEILQGNGKVIRKDFESVFKKIDKHYTSYIKITGVNK